jgi:hypothetical protein
MSVSCKWVELEGYRALSCEPKHLGEVFVGVGNTKIGPNIITYSIPPDRVILGERVVVTCPGATPWCRRHCYAKRGRLAFPANASKYASNLVLFLELGKDRFAELLASKIVEVYRRRGLKEKIVRLHVAGDIFSVEYGEALRAVAESLPDFRFYTYTRSWLVPELMPILEKLRKLENFVIYASTDPDTGPPPPGWLEACCVDTSYRPGFKPYTRTVRCLEETAGLTCEQCRICIYGRASVHWEVIR